MRWGKQSFWSCQGRCCLWVSGGSCASGRNSASCQPWAMSSLKSLFSPWQPFSVLLANCLGDTCEHMWVSKSFSIAPRQCICSRQDQTPVLAWAWELNWDNTAKSVSTTIHWHLHWGLFWCCISSQGNQCFITKQGKANVRIWAQKEKVKLSMSNYCSNIAVCSNKSTYITFWTITWITCPEQNSRNHLWCLLRSESFVVPFHLNCRKDREGNDWNRCPWPVGTLLYEQSHILGCVSSLVHFSCCPLNKTRKRDKGGNWELIHVLRFSILEA